MECLRKQICVKVAVSPDNWIPNKVVHPKTKETQNPIRNEAMDIKTKKRFLFVYHKVKSSKKDTRKTNCNRRVAALQFNNRLPSIPHSNHYILQPSATFHTIETINATNTSKLTNQQNIQNIKISKSKLCYIKN